MLKGEVKGMKGGGVRLLRKCKKYGKMCDKDNCLLAGESDGK